MERSDINYLSELILASRREQGYCYPNMVIKV